MGFRKKKTDEEKKQNLRDKQIAESRGMTPEESWNSRWEHFKEDLETNYQVDKDDEANKYLFGSFLIGREDSTLEPFENNDVLKSLYNGTKGGSRLGSIAGKYLHIAVASGEIKDIAGKIIEGLNKSSPKYLKQILDGMDEDDLFEVNKTSILTEEGKLNEVSKYVLKAAITHLESKNSAYFNKEGLRLIKEDPSYFIDAAEKWYSGKLRTVMGEKENEMTILDYTPMYQILTAMEA